MTLEDLNEGLREIIRENYAAAYPDDPDYAEHVHEWVVQAVMDAFLLGWADSKEFYSK